MKIKGFNIYIILISIIIILGLYFAVINLYDYYNVKTPLKNKLMSIEGIKEVSIDKEDEVKILVYLAPNLDLYDSYQSIYNISEEVLGNNSFEIVFDFLSSKEIEEIYYDIHYYLYEGYENRKYKEMRENIDRIMQKWDKDYLLWVDEKRLYFQINDTDRSFYKIIELNGGVSGA